MPDISSEIRFKTARSGGKGGQNVNKVETMVEGSWDIIASALFSIEEKELIIKQLANKINRAGCLIIKSQKGRTQLENKLLVLKKSNACVEKALIIKKKRKATTATKASQQKRLDVKKKSSAIKQGRKKIEGYE